MSDFKTFAIAVAREAGKIMKKDFAFQMKKDWKQDLTPVTVTDTAINKMVIEAVNKEFPEHDILAEELSDMNQKSDYVWVCDPLDGTIAYSHGLPTCVFSLALTFQGAVILGVVYDPFLDRMFVAEKGKGTFCNNEPIAVSSLSEMTDKTVVNVSTWPDAKFDTLPVFLEMYHRKIKLLRPGSIAYCGTMVASGGFVAAVFPGIFPHDVAAVKIIVEEAGGKVTDLFGNEQRYDGPTNGCLITNGRVHSELITLINRHIHL